jgi:hypothetical protein
MAYVDNQWTVRPQVNLMRLHQTWDKIARRRSQLDKRD